MTDRQRAFMYGLLQLNESFDPDITYNEMRDAIHDVMQHSTRSWLLTGLEMIKDAVIEIQGPNRPKCETCESWDKWGSGSGPDKQGWCRKHPPSTVHFNSDETNAFPVTSANDWCSEHKRSNP